MSRPRFDALRSLSELTHALTIGIYLRPFIFYGIGEAGGIWKGGSEILRYKSGKIASVTVW